MDTVQIQLEKAPELDSKELRDELEILKKDGTVQKRNPIMVGELVTLPMGAFIADDQGRLISPWDYPKYYEFLAKWYHTST